ncbi:MAG: hypothetical protein FWE28_08460 [Oscillospiraceae bacterium]|nr:hypothetical protein [Oscillospiraceae bacterium]
MKIHTNPHFPLSGPAAENLSPGGDTDTFQFIRSLEARNTLALARLRDGFQPREPAVKHHIHQMSGSQVRRFSGVTGPPIDVPGGHVHLVEGEIVE